jgi:hypothetical protein
VLRFRENEVAISGDISKMYHPVLFPKEDQDVHRFLWRNLEMDREPDDLREDRTYIRRQASTGYGSDCTS